ncbi:MAG: hypothetical protein ACRDY0_11615, partial [Acidimicrobiales bacterium]
NLVVQEYGLCPPAPAPDAASLAEQFWRQIPLPVPRPTIPPGSAISGLPAYLVTNGTVSPPAYSETTVLGPLSVAASGSYSVDWGDGASSGPFASEGQPYPSGNIAHTYDVVGSYTVTVTESWIAHWQLGAASGDLAQLQTQARIPSLAVGQVQAVITG